MLLILLGLFRELSAARGACQPLLLFSLLLPQDTGNRAHVIYVCITIAEVVKQRDSVVSDRLNVILLTREVDARGRDLN